MSNKEEVLNILKMLYNDLSNKGLVNVNIQLTFINIINKIQDDDILEYRYEVNIIKLYLMKIVEMIKSTNKMDLNKYDIQLVLDYFDNTEAITKPIN